MGRNPMMKQTTQHSHLLIRDTYEEFKKKMRTRHAFKLRALIDEYKKEIEDLERNIPSFYLEK